MSRWKDDSWKDSFPTKRSDESEIKPHYQEVYDPDKEREYQQEIEQTEQEEEDD